MYWKKVRSNSELFSYRTANRRKFFRVSPSEIEPVSFKFGETEVRIINISGGGLSFRNNNFQLGESHLVNFDLPGQSVAISTNLEILGIDKQGVCHCHFKTVQDEAVDTIIQYVLERQKQVITAGRKRSKQKRPKGPSESKTGRNKEIADLTLIQKS